jgi:hypothetical protein
VKEKAACQKAAFSFPLLNRVTAEFLTLVTSGSNSLLKINISNETVLYLFTDDGVHQRIRVGTEHLQ